MNHIEKVLQKGADLGQKALKRATDISKKSSSFLKKNGKDFVTGTALAAAGIIGTGVALDQSEERTEKSHMACVAQDFHRNPSNLDAKMRAATQLVASPYASPLEKKAARTFIASRISHHKDLLTKTPKTARESAERLITFANIIGDAKSANIGSHYLKHGYVPAEMLDIKKLLVKGTPETPKLRELPKMPSSPTTKKVTDILVADNTHR